MAARLLPGLERRLRADKVGDVRFDAFTRGRYATDASHYQMMPLGVVTPRTIEEAERAIAICRAEGVPVTPRGGGTSQAGQTVNAALIIDCSAHLDRVVELDAADRRCMVEPGIVLDELNRTLKPTGLWFPVDISTASRATIGGMVGNNSCGARSLRYGNTRENVLVDRRGAGRRHARAFRPLGDGRTDPPQALIRDLLRHRRARGGRNRAAVSQSAAPRRRLQSRCARRRAGTTSISRISWSARKARSPSQPESN